MQSLGFVVTKMGSTQLSYEICKSAQGKMEFDPLVFYSSLGKQWITPLFAMMNIGEIYSFGGLAVATDIMTANFLRKCPGPKGRGFYLWDLEWIRHGRTFDEYLDVYSDPSLTLIARSDEHARLIEKCWNREISGVVPHCDLNRIGGILREKKNGKT